ncbi:HK97-gp10 family putative phage morphogenesis protein [Macromonas nakdongensis]|uniref:HK97-gp10 family putative phage morphogenesis protein n=1 Tax=Macromonas nakdongensis TaxID=1843082 RepID=UPI000C336CC4|nr:HK97-gp10 family putative phage morphogenesis protein [Macromonas nakdongensis]
MAKRSIKVAFDDSKAQAKLDAMLAASRSAVRPAAQAGAEVLYQEARLRCPVSEAPHFFYGTSYKKTGQRYLFAPGTLRDSIYQVFSKDNSQGHGQGYDRVTYHIAWNHQKAPYGFMVEFGTSRAPAHPFLRPAFDARRNDALQQAKAEWVAKVGQVIQ